MKNQPTWYYIEGNKSHGPVSNEDLIDKIRSSQLGPFDLVYKTGEQNWRSLSDFKEFYCIFEEIATHHHKEWILLTQNSKKKNQFNMTGPFSYLEVQQKIQEGQVRYIDYAWKPGMTRWYKISQLTEFNPQEHKRIEFPQLKEEFSISTPDEVVEIKNIMFQKRKETKLHENTPPLKPEKEWSESDRDPIKSTSTHKEKLPLQKDTPSTISQPWARKSQSHQKNHLFTEAFKKNKNFVRKNVKTAIEKLILSYYFAFQRLPKKMRSLRTLVSLFFILGFSFFLISKLLNTKELSFFRLGEKTQDSSQPLSSLESSKQALQSENPLSSPSSDKTQSSTQNPQNLSKEFSQTKPQTTSPTIPQNQKKKVVTKNTIPFQLKIFTRGLKGPHPTLNVVLNRPSSNIQVTLHGQAGSLSQRKSFYRRFIFKNKNKIKLNLSRFNLSHGGYTAKAIAGPTEKKVSFFFGKKSQFRNNIKKIRKSISFFQQHERYNIFNLSRILEKKSNSFIDKISRPNWSQGKRRSFRLSWVREFRKISSYELRKINWKNTSQFIYPKIWMDLKDLKLRFINKANQLQNSKNKKNLVRELKGLSEEFKEIHNKSKTLSLWF